jgi:hypothetical protein
MTGPKRELPPLVVRIISDTKDALNLTGRSKTKATRTTLSDVNAKTKMK